MGPTENKTTVLIKTTPLISLLLLLFSFGFAQQPDSTLVVSRLNYPHLNSAPVQIKCNNQTLELCVSGYKNGMPLADNNQIHWGTYIGDCSSGTIDFEKHSKIKCIYNWTNIYLVFENEIYIYANTTNKNYIRKKVYQVPEFVVMEYTTNDNQAVQYIKSKGFGPIGRVD